MSIEDTEGWAETTSRRLGWWVVKVWIGGVSW